MIRIVVGVWALAVGCRAPYPLDSGRKPDAPPGQMAIGVHLTQGLTKDNEPKILVTDADGELVSSLDATGHDWVFVPEGGAVTQAYVTEGGANLDVRTTLEDGDLVFFEDSGANGLDEVRQARVFVPETNSNWVTVTTSCSHAPSADFDVYTEQGLVEDRTVYVPITEACPPTDEFDVIAWNDVGEVTSASVPVPANRKRELDVTLEPFGPREGCVSVQYLGDEEDIVPYGLGLRNTAVKPGHVARAECLRVDPRFHHSVHAVIVRGRFRSEDPSTLVHQRFENLPWGNEKRVIEFEAGEMPPLAENWSYDASGVVHVPMPEGWTCEGGRPANYLRLFHYSEEASFIWFGDYREQVVLPRFGAPWDDVLANTSTMEARILSVEGGYRGQVSSPHIHNCSFAMLQFLPEGTRICDARQLLRR